jgi:hypothetical protein
MEKTLVLMHKVSPREMRPKSPTIPNQLRVVGDSSKKPYCFPNVGDLRKSAKIPIPARAGPVRT